MSKLETIKTHKKCQHVHFIMKDKENNRMLMVDLHFKK